MLSDAHEETIFHFTDQNIDLQLLSQKITEYLSKSWPEVTIRHNEMMKGYEIAAINDGIVQKLLSGIEKLFIVIKGTQNDFTIAFYTPTGAATGSLMAGQAGASGGGAMRGTLQKSKLELLRSIEELAYSLSKREEPLPSTEKDTAET